MLTNLIEILLVLFVTYTLFITMIKSIGDLCTMRFIGKNVHLPYQQFIAKARDHKVFMLLRGNPALDRAVKIISQQQIEQYIYNKLMLNIELDQDMINDNYQYSIDGFNVSLPTYYNSLVAEQEYIDMDTSTRLAVLNAFMFRNNMFYLNFTYTLNELQRYPYQKFHVDNISEESVFYKYMVVKKTALV